MQHGQEVVLVARRAHFEVLAAQGLRIDSPSGSEVLDVPVVARPHAVRWRADDVVVLCVKSQHTADAIAAIAASAASHSTPIVCLQNGVTNELEALRFDNVYGATVMCPTRVPAARRGPRCTRRRSPGSSTSDGSPPA